jgi:hypothetical protein
MKTLVPFLLLIGLAVIGQTVAQRITTVVEPATVHKSETRFAIRYCGSQYTNQTDVATCLVRLLPPSAAQHS